MKNLGLTLVGAGLIAFAGCSDSDGNTADTGLTGTFDGGANPGDAPVGTSDGAAPANDANADTHAGDTANPADSGSDARGPITAANGGTIASEDGNLIVTIPPGALARDTDITVVPDTELEDGKLGSKIYDVGPDGTPLEGEVELCFFADLTNQERGDTACLGYFDEQGDPPQWRCEDGCLEQKDTLLCGNTDHFTSFAVLLSGGDGDGKCRDRELVRADTGGTVTGLDGVVQVTIPAGALRQDSVITVVEDDEPPAVKLASPPVDLGPNGTLFSEPIEVCLQVEAGLNRSDIDGACLAYKAVDGNNSRWLCEDTCLEATSETTLCGTTSHFTSFGVLLGGGACVDR